MQERILQLYNLCKSNPKTSIGLLSTIICGLGIYKLRKIHHKFITYPEMGGRSNASNTKEFRHPRNRNLDSQDLQLTTQDNIKIRGWYIKHPQARQIIVFYHQNAGNIGGRLYFIQSLMKRVKANVIIVAYRGFSDSQGNDPPTQQNIMTDAKTILREAIKRSHEEKLPLFIFGRSLGGATAIYVLSLPQFKSAVKGLVLENTFTSIYDVAKNIVPAILSPFNFIIWLVTSHSFRSVERIKNVKVPILFVKGCRDELIPKQQMDQLEKICEINKLQHFRYQVEDGTHNDTWYRGGEQYFRVVNEFMLHCARL